MEKMLMELEIEEKNLEMELNSRAWVLVESIKTSIKVEGETGLKDYVPHSDIGELMEIIGKMVDVKVEVGILKKMEELKELNKPREIHVSRKRKIRI